MIPKHFGTVKKGKFVPNKPVPFRVAFEKLEGKEVEVVVRKKTKKRSNPQNAYLHGVVFTMIAAHSGYQSVNEVKEAMKGMFLKVYRDGLPPAVRGTSELKTDELEIFASQVREWASDFLDLYIPLPNEVQY